MADMCKNCDDCKYLYDLEPCVKCVNGNMFEAMEFETTDICKSCEYEDAAFMPCNACNNGSEFRLKGYHISDHDSDDIANQADAYVRDHLLIQYMMWKFGKACMLDIEDIYDEWIKWLEEKE